MQTLTEKLILLQAASSTKTRAVFSKMVGINTVTLSRMSERGEATDRVLMRLAGPFENVTLDMLRDNNQYLPDEIKLNANNSERLHEANIRHEGKQLGRYLDRLGRGSRAQLADKLGVSRVQVNSYEKTDRFTPEVKKTILAAIKVPEEVVFTERTLSLQGVVPNVSMVGLPLFQANDRQLTPQALADFQRDFKPVLMPGRVHYINTDVLAHRPQDLSRALAIEVIESDHMAPIYQIGAILMAVRIEPKDWNEADGSILAQVSNKLTIRRVYRNELRTSNLIEVGAYDRSRGGTLTLRREDIQALFSVTHILLSPA